MLRTEPLLVGAWCHIPSAFSAELLGRAGPDWICVDTQHGVIGYEAMVPMLRAANACAVPAVVRVTSNDPGLIGLALDAGADGVIVPMVNSPEDAERAVRACRYPPEGDRSWGPVLARLRSEPYDAAAANESVACIVQIETAEAAANADAILETDGLDAVYVGPNDLSLTSGLDPTDDPEDEEQIATIERIAAACRRHGVAPGIHCGTVETAARWKSAGFRMLNIANDARFMRAAAQAAWEKLRVSE